MIDETEFVVGVVKDAVNKIQMKTSTLNDLTLVSPLNVSPPPSSSSSSSSSSPLFGEHPPSVSIRRCQSMKFRESPKEIKRTPSYLNNESIVKKITEDLISSTSALNFGQSTSTTSLNENSAAVPTGIVKRQVESINFKSRPCTPESEENCVSALNNELAMGSTNELLKLQENKRFRIESNENLCGVEQQSSSTAGSNRSSKKVFEFLADKLKSEEFLSTNDS
jgi:hypothetical protein